MLLPQDKLEAAQGGERTIVDFLIGAVLKEAPARWRDYVIAGASDVDDARTIDLLPSDTQLTLLEREISKGDHETRLRKIVGSLLTEARSAYDLVLIDSAPGLSVLTECWLREADFYVSPTRPDYISTRGLEFLRQFRARDEHMGFAEPLGVIINMKDAHSMEDAQYEHWLRENSDHKCFRQPILRVSPLQAATRFAERPRSYWAKYPGQTGANLRDLANELLWRLAVSQPGATQQASASRNLPVGRQA
jgi:chromosome partitioning protein